MRHRQETVVEKGWDGEFETYDEWARFGPRPRIGVRSSSMLTVDVVLLSESLIEHGRTGHSR